MTDQRVLPGPQGSRFSSITHVAETGSTNADLLVAAADGVPEGAVRVTDHQTAGRGRQARAWHDEPGNSMLMSVLLRPGIPVAQLVPLLAGLAITDAVADLAVPSPPAAGGPDGAVEDDSGLALKWPNDVLVPSLGERKLAGILSEAAAEPDAERLAVVVGMGLNIRWEREPIAEVAERAATLEAHLGRPVDRWEVVAAVLTALDRWLVRIEDEGPDPVLATYRERCCTLGRRLRLQRPSDVLEGRAVAIADTGALVIDTGAELVTVTAGDAHHV